MGNKIKRNAIEVLNLAVMTVGAFTIAFYAAGFVLDLFG